MADSQSSGLNSADLMEALLGDQTGIKLRNHWASTRSSSRTGGHPDWPTDSSVSECDYTFVTFLQAPQINHWFPSLFGLGKSWLKLSQSPELWCWGNSLGFQSSARNRQRHARSLLDNSSLSRWRSECIHVDVCTLLYPWTDCWIWSHRFDLQTCN